MGYSMACLAGRPGGSLLGTRDGPGGGAAGGYASLGARFLPSRKSITSPAV